MTTDKNHYETIRREPLFDVLSDETVTVLAGDAVEREYKRGTLLFFQDEPPDRIYFVLAGWVKLFRDTSDGNECLVALLSQGELFGETAALDPMGFPANAVVAEDARLLTIPTDCFRRLLRENKELAQNLLIRLAGLLRQHIHRIDQLANQPTQQRVAAFLVSLCPCDGGSAVIHLPCDKVLIAARLGMKPESFSRAMARLRAVGVHCKGHTVHVDDLPMLRRIADGMRPAINRATQSAPSAVTLDSRRT
ncbi:Crp/Fnr family transcriptional regulator [Aquisalimonas sp.]|uniref:Crp/Fnr family transcriptional regulator n=1 Tax=Aquisalimonas sp. TaxID=1872621 RepID=UPI0025BCA202|nr:Crp/Fnr family transcriptional regulator [Aquisalimonas sp.]